MCSQLPIPCMTTSHSSWLQQSSPPFATKEKASCCANETWPLSSLTLLMSVARRFKSLFSHSGDKASSTLPRMLVHQPLVTKSATTRVMDLLRIGGHLQMESSTMVVDLCKSAGTITTANSPTLPMTISMCCFKTLTWSRLTAIQPSPLLCGST